MRNLASLEKVKMTIEKRPPPNAAEIEKVFPGVCSGARPIYFCYGDIIYNPSGTIIPPSLIAHEMVHSLQQEALGRDLWWNEYLWAPTFRYGQELEAHRVEYEHYRSTNNRAFSRRYLVSVAERLAGPLYGGLVRKREALAAIKQEDIYELDTSAT